MKRVRGSTNARREPLLWIDSGFPELSTLQRRSIRIAERMRTSLKKAFPEIDSEFIRHVVADLDSLWDLGQKLDADLKKLFRMRFPKHRDELYHFLIDVEVRQLDEASYLVRQLRKRVPTLIKALHRQELSERRRTRTHS
jgi:hypothetical protein